MSCEEFTQDPLDTRKITVNFAPWLAAIALINSVAWVVPAALTTSNTSNTTTTATNHFKGAAGEYIVKCTIQTNEANAREKTVSFKILIEESCN